jgi:alpha-maltose-1-phosphate synthase
MSKKILMLLDNHYNNDRRVFTASETLAEAGYNVTVVALKNDNFKENETRNGVEIFRLLEKDIFDIKQLNVHKKYARLIADGFDFDIIHAHDQEMLNLGVEIKKIKKNAKLIYDSHEMFHEWPLNLSNFSSFWIAIKSYLVRKTLIFRERRNIKHVDRIITVNQSLATILAKYFKHDQEIIFLRNFPRRNYAHGKNNLIREKLGIDASKKILIYIGQNVYLKTLNIEQVLLELKNQIGIDMVFVCGVETPSAQQVIKFTKDNGIDNIHFLNRVRPDEITTYLQGADVGILATWNKKNKSYWFALGNKFFEYIQAGIPVLATAQPEHIPILKKYQCGVLVNPDQHGVFLEGFRKIISNYEFYRMNTIEASKELCWENEYQKLLTLYSEL